MNSLLNTTNQMPPATRLKDRPEVSNFMELYLAYCGEGREADTMRGGAGTWRAWGRYLGGTSWRLIGEGWGAVSALQIAVERSRVDEDFIVLPWHIDPNTNQTIPDDEI
jgi:hypothetical protein